MTLYPITVDWIPGLPQIPFRGGVNAWEGVVMHQTANCDDTARSERAYESTHYNDAFVHEFIDPNEIIQVANPAYLAYGAGPIANPRFVNLELCNAGSQEEFDRSFDRWCQRAAVYLANRQLGVSVAQSDGSGTIWSHYDVTRYLGGTDHTDPIDYLNTWGKTWQDVIDQVQQHYNALINKEDEEDIATLQKWEADTINGTWISPAWEAAKEKRDECLAAGDQAGADAWQEQMDNCHKLANALRRASGQPEE